jgi:hypothetical protein
LLQVGILKRMLVVEDVIMHLPEPRAARGDGFR